MSHVTTSRILLPAGQELEIAQQGPRHGPVLVLLHGLTDSWRSMAPLMGQLPSHLRVIAPSLRGHGDSSRPAGGYSPADFSSDLAGLLDILGVERAAIFGHSMGALVAQRFALDRPERTDGLVLAGAFPTLRGNDVVETFYRAEVADLQDPVDPGLAWAFQESTLAGPVPDAFLRLVVAESLKVPARVWRATLQALLHDDFSDELGSIRAPTLLVWGEEDALAGAADQARLVRAIAGAALHALPGVGHAPHWEKPRLTAQLVARFLQRQPARAA